MFFTSNHKKASFFLTLSFSCAQAVIAGNEEISGSPTKHESHDPSSPQEKIDHQAGPSHNPPLNNLQIQKIVEQYIKEAMNKPQDIAPRLQELKSKQKHYYKAFLPLNKQESPKKRVIALLSFHCGYCMSSLEHLLTLAKRSEAPEIWIYFVTTPQSPEGNKVLQGLFAAHQKNELVSVLEKIAKDANHPKVHLLPLEDLQTYVSSYTINDASEEAAQKAQEAIKNWPISSFPTFIVETKQDDDTWNIHTVSGGRQTAEDLLESFSQEAKKEQL